MNMKQLINIEGHLEGAEDIIMNTKQKIEEELEKYNIFFSKDLSFMSGRDKLKGAILRLSKKKLINIKN